MQVCANRRRLFEKSSAATARLEETCLKDCRCIWWSGWVTAEHTLLPCQRLGLLSEQHFWPPLAQSGNDQQQNLRLEIPSKGDGKTLSAQGYIKGPCFMVQRFHKYFHSFISNFTPQDKPITSLVTCSLSQDLAWGRGWDTVTFECPATERWQVCTFQNFFSLLISSAKLKEAI